MRDNSAKEALAGNRERRTPRVAVDMPIRVYATDYRGRDFVEDTTTVAINMHGAKIRLGHELIPDQEIRILSGKTGREAIFRVVAKAGEGGNHSTFWGVECLNPEHNIWGLNLPILGPRDQTGVRALMQCPECRVRELLFLDEPLLEKVVSNGGLLRGCLTCGHTGIWKQVPYFES